MPSLAHIDTWLYHLGDVTRARADEIAATNAEMVVTEWASYARDEAPYTPALLDRMRGADEDRLVLSYLSIGEAETYRYYWDTAWQDAPPSWLGTENPEWEGNIKVRYWDADWQAIILDYVDRIIDGGFDGVYLDIVDAYRYWGKQNRAPGVALEQEMADFVGEIRAHAEATLATVDPGRDFHIIGQNALGLTENATYAAAIDGVAREDARFYYEYGRPQDFGPWPDDEYDYVLNQLQRIEASGLSAFAVEYIPDGQLSGVRGVLRAEAQDLGRAGVPLMVATHRDLDSIPDQPGVIDLGYFAPLGPAGTTPPPGNVITGGGGRDSLTGAAGADVIKGRRGSDDLDGRGGADEIFGGAGGDDLFGRGGADLLNGGGGLDNLFGGAGMDRLNGGGRADALNGGRGGDVLKGGAGADELFGGAGKDVLNGGRGGDELRGGNGADRFVFRAGDGADVILDFVPEVDRLAIGPEITDIHHGRAGTYVTYGPGDEVLLRGIDADDWALIAPEL